MRRLLYLIVLLSPPIFIWGATPREEINANPCKAGGIYYAYPVTHTNPTVAPDGYEPFYVSHYGRHGSRYLISSDDYERVVSTLADAHAAGALTALGEDVYQRALAAAEEGRGRGGELTPLGYRQHAGIATRMYHDYPEAFTDSARMTARSTQVMRCAHSMFAFVDALRRLNPALEIPLESNERNMIYLCHSEPPSWKFNDNEGRLKWRADYDNFEHAKVNPDRLMESLFADSEYLHYNVDREAFMWALYWLAVDMQNMETPVSFYDIFTNQELYDLWEVINLSFYIKNSSYPRSDGLNVDNAKNLLTNILTTAREYITDGAHGATLRFGHDGNIVPLAALLRLDGCHGYESDPAKVSDAWQSYRVSPMASNLQIVFFRNQEGNIIVKFLMNEQETSIDLASDIYPFYRWEDVEAYMQEAIEKPSITFCPDEKRIK